MNGARAEPASPVLVALPPNRDSRSIAAEGRSPLPGTLVRQPAIVGTDQRLVRRSAYSDLVPGLSSSSATPGGGSRSMPSARPPTALSPGVPSRPAPVLSPNSPRGGLLEWLARNRRTWTRSRPEFSLSPFQQTATLLDSSLCLASVNESRSCSSSATTSPGYVSHRARRAASEVRRVLPPGGL